MKRIVLFSALVIAGLFVISLTYYNSIQVGEPAYAGCFRSDIENECCAAACQTEKKHGRDKANDVLKNCMRSVLACPKSEIDYATVFNRCNCNK